MRAGWAARAALPEFPWEQLAPYGDTARAHPGGIVDLSIGTPVDPTPQVVQDALRAAADAPGYPLTIGTPALREAMATWVGERLGTPVEAAEVVPSTGSKETVGLLPSLLGLAPGSQVLIPALAYPTYDVGARLAGCEPVATDDPTSHDPSRVGLVWVNSPSNPTGGVLPPEQLRRVAGPVPVYACVAAAELVLLMGAVMTAVLATRYWRPGDARRGMATRREAEQALGLNQLRAGRAVIRPDRYPFRNGRGLLRRLLSTGRDAIRGRAHRSVATPDSRSTAPGPSTRTSPPTARSPKESAR